MSQIKRLNFPDITLHFIVGAVRQIECCRMPDGYDVHADVLFRSDDDHVNAVIGQTYCETVGV